MLAVLEYGAGDPLRTITAAVRYGRDCDSIAGMACGLAGALFGCDAIPASLLSSCDEANQRGFGAVPPPMIFFLHLSIWKHT